MSAPHCHKQKTIAFMGEAFTPDFLSIFFNPTILLLTY